EEHIDYRISRGSHRNELALVQNVYYLRPVHRAQDKRGHVKGEVVIFQAHYSVTQPREKDERICGECKEGYVLQPPVLQQYEAYERKGANTDGEYYECRLYLRLVQIVEKVEYRNNNALEE